ncbi:MAG: ATP-binding protein [bacterium]
MDALLKERMLDFQQTGIPAYIKRDAAVTHVKDMVTTIVGGRKTGKTYLTYQVIDDLLKSGKLASLNHVCYLHFDDEALVAMTPSDLARIDRVFLSLLKRSDHERTLLFVFDEIHAVAGWEHFVLRLKKKPNWLVVVTGSTSDLEEDKVARQLRGKTFTNRLYPLSFSEFIRFNGCDCQADRLSSGDRAAIRGLLDGYFERGGYPALATMSPPLLRQLLQNYFTSIVASDFILNRGLSNPLACKAYLRNLLQKNACPYTHKKELNNLKSMGFNLAPKTVSEWFSWAEESYLIGSAGIGSASVKRIAQNYRKLYCCDWAMANSVTAWPEKRVSRNLETVVYWHLVRAGFTVSYDLAGPDKAEIDFIVSRPGEPPFAAVQVCTELSDESTVEREMKALSWYFKTNPNAHSCVITLESPSRKTEFPIIPIMDFLLGIDPIFKHERDQKDASTNPTPRPPRYS